MNRCHLLALVASPLLACTPVSQPAADLGADGPVATGDLAASSDGLEKLLDVKLALSGATLKITVKDGATPVMTDVWLYTLEGVGVRAFGDFDEPDSARKSRRRMLPCKLAGAASGLIPCDEGDENGLMTDAARERLADGKRAPAIDGTVELTLRSAPKGTLVVIAAIEDQRYAGAAAITPGGAAATVPAGLVLRQKIRARSYAKDVAPLLQTQCLGCHTPNGAAAPFRMTSYDDVVLRDAGYEDEKLDCEEQFPMDLPKREACIAAIETVEYLVEPGAPALSPLLRRTRPDESKSTSELGLRWYGEDGKRFGEHGDRRMPPQNISPETPDDDGKAASYFDSRPADYQLLFDWVAQGAPK